MCVSPMFVIIMGAEICWSTCFATLQICQLTAFEATRRDQMDVSEARNLCWRTRVKDIPFGPPGAKAPLARPSGIFHPETILFLWTRSWVGVDHLSV